MLNAKTAINWSFAAISAGSLSLTGCNSGAVSETGNFQSQKTEWEKIETTDKFTDENHLHYETKDGKLSLTCLKEYKYVGLAINSDEDSSLSDSKVEFPSRVRIDKGEIFSMNWWVYPSKGVITPQTYNEQILVDHMKGGGVLTVEFWPGDSDSKQMSFNIEGFDDAYNEMKKFCI